MPLDFNVLIWAVDEQLNLNDICEKGNSFSYKFYYLLLLQIIYLTNRRRGIKVKKRIIQISKFNFGI